MTAMEYAKTYAEMPVSAKNALLARLHDVLSAEDYATVATHLGLFDMFYNTEKFEAMKEAVKEMVVKDIFGKE